MVIQLNPCRLMAQVTLTVAQGPRQPITAQRSVVIENKLRDWLIGEE